MDAVLRDFGRRGAREDPVVHFYETFLAAYDPKMRKVRGIYYTPGPVVSYIVRSIDHLLKTSFERPRGLADTNTLILDPACGTGTFLYSVIDIIYEALKDQRGAWSAYVEEHLLPRIFGFELLMAPYAVSHMKLGLQLKDTGYDFKGDERLGIYLTNTLEEAKKKSEAMFAQWIADEANAASEIKRDKPIMVVLGNPPYFGHSANKGPWIEGLIEDYKKVDGRPLGEKNPKLLQDDYVKFIRFGQWRIERTGLGILAFITNHGYLDNPTFRGMRQNLIDTFTDIYIIDLHGSSKKKEKAPGGGKDVNVFDIQLGVAISLFVKMPEKTSPCKVHYAELWGLREAKYRCLSENYVASTEWTELKPTPPFYLFVPQNIALLPEYEEGWKIIDIFNVYSTGIKTHRDHFVIDFEENALRARISSFLDDTKSEDEVRQRFNLKDNRDWKLKDKRQAMQQDQNWRDKFTRCLYRPFDIRPIFYHKDAIDFTRPEVMRNMLIANLAMLTCRQQSITGFQHVLCTNIINDDCAVSTRTRERAYNFPLYLYPSGEEGKHDALKEGRRPNLNPEFVRCFCEKLGLPLPDWYYELPSQGGVTGFQPVKKGQAGCLSHHNTDHVLTPEDIFHYAYATFHSPTYRARYAEFLKIDFPRLPLKSNRDLFWVLCQKGAELVSLHLMESPALDNFTTTYPVRGDNVVEKVRYVEPATAAAGREYQATGEDACPTKTYAKARVYINKSQYFEGVDPEVWGFFIGGYQVCHKWLKDRTGRKLSFEEINHYQKIIVSIKETIRLMAEIGALVPSWPLD